MSELYPDSHSERSTGSIDAAVGLADGHDSRDESATAVALRKTITDNKRQIRELIDNNNALTADYILTAIRSPAVITAAIDKIADYLRSHYDSGFEQLLTACRTNLTAAPVKNHLIRISKYGTRVHYDTVLYEWDGKRIVYIRVNENNEYYYDGCSDWNGFSLKDFEMSQAEEDDNYVYMWKTETPNNWTNVDKVERGVKLPHSRDFSERIHTVPSELQILIAIFDGSDYCHYLISEDVIGDVSCYAP